MRFTLCCLLTLFFAFARGQEEDMTKYWQSYFQRKPQQGNPNNKRLSIKASWVLPVFYDNNRNKPDYKVSYVAGIQYKTKRNLLLEAMFQPYHFTVKSPTEYWNNGLRFGNYNIPYYEIDSYTLYRISVGIGYQKSFNNKSSLGFTIGASLLLGDHGANTNYYSKFYAMNGTPYNPNPFGTTQEVTWMYIRGYFAPYLDICYSYSLIKNLAITASINYCFVHSPDNDFYAWQSLLAVNVGLRYNVIHKSQK
jgi:hypothetical protein